MKVRIGAATAAVVALAGAAFLILAAPSDAGPQDPRPAAAAQPRKLIAG